MAQFPRTEPEIKVLAQNLATGMADNAALYPAPPMTPAALQAVLDSFITLGDEAVAARAAAEQTTVTKEARLEELTNAMRSMLRYAENTVDYSDPDLSLLGWGGKAAAAALEVPGQTRMLEIVTQGEGWLNLDWKKPSDGGSVASYKEDRLSSTIYVSLKPGATYSFGLNSAYHNNFQSEFGVPLSPVTWTFTTQTN